MTDIDSSNVYAFRTRLLPPVALAACALFAATMLLAASAAAGPAPKVEICHIPPGNPANFHTIEVSEKAVPAHLAHGDAIGACNDLCAVLCDDGDVCTIDDTGDCESEGCPPAPRGQKDCNDSNPCTEVGYCDEDTGICVNPPLPGLVCTNTDPGVCDQKGDDNGTCDDAGVCVPLGIQGCCLDDDDCDAADADPCTTEVCDVTSSDPTVRNTCVSDGEGILDCNIGACHPGYCATESPPADCSTDCRDCCCVDLPPIPYPCCEDVLDCDDLFDCTTESCDGSVCSTVENCEPGSACNADGQCEPIEVPCFSMLNAPPYSTVAECTEECETNAGCPPGTCDLKLSSGLGQDCLDGDNNACLTIDAYGRDPEQGGCTNICDPPEPDLLLCGGTACARYDAGIEDLANPVVRNFIDDYMYFHPEDGGPKGFNFAQAIAPDGRYLWASDCGVCRDSDNFTNVWVYDTLLKELTSCDSWGAQGQQSRVCEDSALNLCVGSVCGPVVSNGNWRAAPLVGTHVPAGFYAAGNIGFWQSEPERIVRVSPGGRSPLISRSEMTLGCGDTVPGKLAAAPLDPSDPPKEELYGLVQYSGAPHHYWIVRFNLQGETCEEVVLLNSEAGSNAVPFLSINAITSATTPSSGFQRIRVASDGTIYFLIRPSLDASGDGIWRVSDDNNDGVFDIEKIIDWVDGQNEIWDFTIGPHDGNLYLLLDDEPQPNVGRVTVYDPNVALGDPPLGTVFNLPATHGTQTKIEFFPLD